MSFFKAYPHKERVHTYACTPFSPWSKPIPTELLSSRAQVRFNFDSINFKCFFFNFNPSILWEVYNAFRS